MVEVKTATRKLRALRLLHVHVCGFNPSSSLLQHIRPGAGMDPRRIYVPFLQLGKEPDYARGCCPQLQV